MFEKPNANEQAPNQVENTESLAEGDLNTLEENNQQLEAALDSVGGEEGLQTMLEEIPDEEKQRILDELEEEHERKMSEILRAQEKAGKMMDYGLESMWNPKFAFQEARKNHEYKAVDPNFNATFDTMAWFGSGANIFLGGGTAVTGSVKHLISRVKELRENRRYERSRNEV